MYSCNERFLHTLKCYFSVYFPSCEATRKINTKITISWALKPFTTQVPTLFSTHIARLMGPTWGLPGSCRPQVGPMNLAIRVYITALPVITPLHWLTVHAAVNRNLIGLATTYSDFSFRFILKNISANSSEIWLKLKSSNNKSHGYSLIWSTLKIFTDHHSSWNIVQSMANVEILQMLKFCKHGCTTRCCAV